METGPIKLSVSSNRLGQPGIELRTPGYKASDLSNNLNTAAPDAEHEKVL